MFENFVFVLAIVFFWSLSKAGRQLLSLLVFMVAGFFVALLLGVKGAVGMVYKATDVFIDK